MHGISRRTLPLSLRAHTTSQLIMADDRLLSDRELAEKSRLRRQSYFLSFQQPCVPIDWSSATQMHVSQPASPTAIVESTNATAAAASSLAVVLDAAAGSQEEWRETSRYPTTGWSEEQKSLFDMLKNQAAGNKAVVFKGLAYGHADPEIGKKLETWAKREQGQMAVAQMHVSTSGSGRLPVFEMNRKSLSMSKFPAVFLPDYVNQAVFVGMSFHFSNSVWADVISSISFSQLVKGKGSIPDLLFYGCFRIPGRDLPLDFDIKAPTTAPEGEVQDPMILSETVRRLLNHVKCFIFWDNSNVFKSIIQKEINERPQRMGKEGTKMHLSRAVDFRHTTFIDTRDQVFRVLRRKGVPLQAKSQQELDLFDALKTQTTKELTGPSARSKATGMVFDLLRDDLYECFSLPK